LNPVGPWIMVAVIQVTDILEFKDGQADVR